jgi:hypothetical protein
VDRSSSQPWKDSAGSCTSGLQTVTCSCGLRCPDRGAQSQQPQESHTGAMTRLPSREDRAGGGARGWKEGGGCRAPQGATSLLWFCTPHILLSEYVPLYSSFFVALGLELRTCACQTGALRHKPHPQPFLFYPFFK